MLHLVCSAVAVGAFGIATFRGVEWLEAGPIELLTGIGFIHRFPPVADWAFGLSPTLPQP
jgi:hypothetical protein